MTFLWPHLLTTVFLVPIGIVVARRIDRRRGKRALVLTGTAVPHGTRRPRAHVPAAMATVAFVVFAVALARPQASVALPHLEATLMLTFDVSASMAADDVAPSRLEAAKAIARQVVEEKPAGIVVGVVAFSNGGISVQAPTDDSAAVLAAIERLTPTEGTSLGSGILAALDAIALAAQDTPAAYYSGRSPEPSALPAALPPGSDAGTIIVVFSDGENTADPEPVEAAQQAADRGIRLVTVGVGTTEGATLDLDGFSIRSTLEQATLQQMADTTSGWYQSASDLVAARLYDDLSRRLVLRTELQEVSAPVAAVGLLLLIAGASVSVARAGRLP